jgi:hypothetical protein
VQVVAQHGIDGIARRQTFGGHAHGHEQQKGRDEKVAGAAAGVEQLEGGQRVGPTVKAAGGGDGGRKSRRWRDGVIGRAAPLRRCGRHGAQVGELYRAGLAGVACVPPRTQRVVEQELHHVGFGEELGDGGQLVRTDFDFGGVDLVLALGLPELIDPAQAVAGLEYLGGKAPSSRSSSRWYSGAKPSSNTGLLRFEYLRQHARGQLAGQFPAAFAAKIGGGIARQFFTFGERHRRAGLPEQQVVFGKEAGKQHAVPVLVGDFPHQRLQFDTIVLRAACAYGTGVSAQFPS